MAAERGIKTRCGRCSLVLRNLDGGPNEATYTGSYSTRRGGMITTGCPGSSPHTPELWGILSKSKTAFHTR